MLDEQLGYLQEMHGMRKVWDRSEHPGLVSGIRFVYEAIVYNNCRQCNQQTRRVIDYLGRLEFNCGDCKQ